MSGAWKADHLVSITVEDDGIGARPPTTVNRVFQKTVAFKPDAIALSTKSSSGKWKRYSWRQYYDTSARFAKSLIHIGVEAHDAVNIIGHNSPEWFFVNNGTIMAGGIIAGIYTTNGPESCQYISEHCDARVVVVENMTHLNKYLKIAHNLPKLKALVMWEGEVPHVDCGVPIYALDDFLKLGAGVSDVALTARIDAQLPGHCCTLIYTSGTTGPPKAVMISHDNFTWTAYNVLETLYGVTEHERSVSFLPLSHVAAQLLDIHVPMHLGSQVSFAGPDALRGALVETLREIRPTFFFGVPRVWEKVMESMRAIGANTTGFKKVLASWAKDKGAKKTERFQFGGDARKSLSFRLANRVVLSKIKDALGLDQCRYCFTGAAPLSVDCLAFFGSLDIPIYEIFGQSECTGPHSINLPGKWKIGSIGNPLPATQTRIDPQTGEIRYAGRHIFMGYLNNEDATRATLIDGWLHSGDVGTFDDDGFLAITGRIKELIITAGGENIPPVLIEDALKLEMPALSNVMVIGDKRKFLTFVCTLRVAMDADGNPTQQLDGPALKAAKEIGSSARTVQAAQQCDKWQQYITSGMKRANAKAISRATHVQKFVVLDHDFSIPGGELTPTLKLKRSVVEKMYAAVIEGMYE